jgi:hypothetical protein
MNLTNLSTLLGLAGAALVAYRLGDAHGTGVIAGYLAGASLSLALVSRQRRVLATRPQRALQTMVEGFLAKLAAVVLATLAILLVPALRQGCDLASFLLAFGAAAVIALLAGTWANARVLRGPDLHGDGLATGERRVE